MSHDNYQRKRDSRNICYRLLFRHQHEAVALSLYSRFTTLLKRRRDLYKGAGLKPVSPKKCAGLKPVSPEKCARIKPVSPKKCQRLNWSYFHYR